MTPGARIAAAIVVLDGWLAGQPVEQALTNWARGARYAGSGDRAAVRDLVFDVLRARGSCAHLGQGGDGRALMLGLLRLQGRDPVADFTGLSHAPPPLTPAEAAPPPTDPDPLCDLPDWMVPLFEARVGGDLAQLVARFRDRAPLYLRVNTAKATPAATCAALAAEGITARPDPRAVTALEVMSGARQVKTSVPYAQGWVEPQDLSVQRAILAVDWRGCSVLDYCAGGGGKALAIATLGAARIVAHDADPRRMADLALRAARSDAAITMRATGELPKAGPFDVVLCDVPCSGSGTWRRDPEAKWRLTPDRLAALETLQAQILDAAIAHLQPGGRLVYMTCSLFHAENEAQIARFIARHPGWRCESAAVQSPIAAYDGFFHAVLRAP